MQILKSWEKQYETRVSRGYVINGRDICVTRDISTNSLYIKEVIEDYDAMLHNREERKIKISQTGVQGGYSVMKRGYDRNGGFVSTQRFYPVEVSVNINMTMSDEELVTKFIEQFSE